MRSSHSERFSAITGAGGGVTTEGCAVTKMQRIEERRSASRAPMARFRAPEERICDLRVSNCRNEVVYTESTPQKWPVGRPKVAAFDTEMTLL